MKIADFLYSLSQIPSDALEEVLACVLIGVKKHGADTMGKSDRITELDCIYRHYMALEHGEIYDEDDGQHHASAIAVRCLKIIHMDEGEKKP